MSNLLLVAARQKLQRLLGPTVGVLRPAPDLRSWGLPCPGNIAGVVERIERYYFQFLCCSTVSQSSLSGNGLLPHPNTLCSVAWAL